MAEFFRFALTTAALKSLLPNFPYGSLEIDTNWENDYGHAHSHLLEISFL